MPLGRPSSRAVGLALATLLVLSVAVPVVLAATDGTAGEWGIGADSKWTQPSGGSNNKYGNVVRPDTDIQNVTAGLVDKYTTSGNYTLGIEYTSNQTTIATKTDVSVSGNHTFSNTVLQSGVNYTIYVKEEGAAIEAKWESDSTAPSPPDDRKGFDVETGWEAGTKDSAHFFAVDYITAWNTTTSTYEIHGQVTDSSGNPIDGASIKIVNQSDSNTEFSGTTDANGVYNATGIESGYTYDVTASKSGYDSETKAVTVSGSDVKVDFSLSESSGSLGGDVLLGGGGGGSSSGSSVPVVVMAIVVIASYIVVFRQ